MKPGDKYWFPPHPSGAVEGIIMTVMKAEIVRPYGEVIFWTDGSWMKATHLDQCHLIDDTLMRKLWETRNGS